MATQTSNDFPLATDDPNGGDAGSVQAPGYGVGDAGGASGKSSGLSLSTGGLVAIIVVVVLVSIVGGMPTRLCQYPCYC